MSEKPKTPPVGYDDTPFLPGGKWRVHDANRPQPAIIDPGTPSTQEAPGRPPSDAIVLFDGTDASQWQTRDGGPVGWKGDLRLWTFAQADLLLKGMSPRQLGEPAVVPVGRDPLAARFNGQSSQVGIRYEVALDVRCSAQVLEDGPMPGPGLDGDAVGLVTNFGHKR